MEPLKISNIIGIRFIEGLEDKIRKHSPRK